MNRYDLKQPYGTKLNLELKPGMGWAIYTDTGPNGPCGQSMSVTCPHAIFATWPDEESMKKDINSKFRNGKNTNIQYGVIGEWSTGNCAVIDFKE